MTRQFRLRSAAFLALALASCALGTACVQSNTRTGGTPRSSEELRLKVAQQEEANRVYSGDIERRFLSTTRDQSRDADFEKRLGASVARDLGPTGAVVERVECRGRFCKIMIRLGSVPSSNTVLFAVTRSPRCEIPLLELPSAADKTRALVYIDCGISGSQLG